MLRRDTLYAFSDWAWAWTWALVHALALLVAATLLAGGLFAVGVGSYGAYQRLTEMELGDARIPTRQKPHASSADRSIRPR